MNSLAWRRRYYHFKHNYLTVNNIVLAGACLLALGLAWNSVTIMQRNFTLQRNLDMKQRQKTLTELQVQTLEYQKEYHKSTEYKDLAARKSLGLASPGEKLLILPPNTSAAAESQVDAGPVVARIEPTNFEQWMDFLSGRNVHDLRKDG